MRECGLKLRRRHYSLRLFRVTPRAGVWIETVKNLHQYHVLYVTPRAGVWIETLLLAKVAGFLLSLPVRECGLKHDKELVGKDRNCVTPRAGVWIETLRWNARRGLQVSLPVRECGLKHRHGRAVVMA